MSDNLRDWSELPADLVPQIAGRLQIADFNRFGAVCRPWFKITKSHGCRPKQQMIPWLMLSSLASPDSRYFYSLEEERVYEINVPQISDLHCIGSSEGALISIDEEAQLHITNPLTGAHSPLPSTATLPKFHGTVQRDPATGKVTDYLMWYDRGNTEEEVLPLDIDYIRNYYFHKAIISNATVFIIHSQTGQIAFARPVDACWTPLTSTLKCLDDLIFHKGRLHAIDFAGRLTVFDLDRPSGPPSLVSLHGPAEDLNSMNKRYLVESPDGRDLFLIYRDVVDGVGIPPKWRTKGFVVFILDESKYTWRQVTDVGDYAVFLGFNRSMSLSVRDFPELRRNSIYFSDDLRVVYLDEPDQVGDMGVCDLGDGTIHSLNPSNIDIERLNWPPALWFTPVLP